MPEVHRYVAQDARLRLLLLAVTQQAIEFGEKVQGAEITFADYDAIADFLAAMDAAQIEARVTPEPRSGVLAELHNGREVAR